MIVKPILIDTLIDIHGDVGNVMTELDGKWYISKPLQLNDLDDILERLYHAWLIIIGKAKAYQYVEDL